MTTPNRRTFALLSLGFAAFIVYGSWVPFDFRHREWGDAGRSFVEAMKTRAIPQSRSDGLANLLLGVPLGFALLGWACVDRRERRAELFGPLLLPLCVGLAVIVEFGQVYLPTRTCSGSDVLAQGFGAALGMVAWGAFGQRLTEQARVVWAKSSGAVPRLLVVYLVLLAFIQMLPLDLSPSPADLYRKLRDKVQYIPFGELKNTTDAEWWNRIGTLCQVFALYMPIGLLAANLPRQPDPTRLFAYTIGIAVGMESLQLVVHSRSPSSTDVIVGVCGVLGGWAVGRQRFAWWMAGAWLVLLTVHAWQPWTSRTDGVSFDWIPGLPLESGDPLFALEEFLTKSVLFSPLGVIAARHRPALAPLVGSVVAMVFEIGQLFVSSRYPGVTDIVIGGFGAWAGATATRLATLR